MIGFVFALLLALPGGARAQTLLSESFTRAGVIAAPGKPSAQWATEAGQLLSKRGTGYSDSRVLRLFTRRSDFKSVTVTFNLLTAAFHVGSPDEEQPWDGVHLWLRYQSDDSHYDLGINRRDGTVVLKKKGPGAGGAAFFTIGAPASYAIPFNSWQSVRASISDEPNGSVAISLYMDDTLVLHVLDDGSQGGAPISEGGRIGLRADNAELHLADFQVAEFAGASATPLEVLAASATVRGGQALVTWRTPSEADSLVQFGLTADYGGTTPGGWGKDHVVTLNGLAPGAYHFRVRSSGPKGALQSADATFTVAAVDASLPTLTVTSPAQGQQLSGLASASAIAGDASGFVIVKFLIDGLPLGSPLLSPPFTVSFNSALYASGSHAFTAVARNAMGAQSVATSSFTISNGVTAPVATGVAGAVPNVFPQPTSAADPSAVAAAGGAAAGGASSGAAVPGAAVPGAAATTAPTVPTGGPAPAAFSAAAAVVDPVRAPERFLSPAIADGINDLAHFGAQAAEVTIFDIRGRRVFHAQRQGGSITWNGRDLTGRLVESGVYIARIIGDDGKAVYQSFAVAK